MNVETIKRRKTKELNGCFGLWTIISKVETPINAKGSHYFCRCQCGLQKVVRGSTLKHAESTSCKHCSSLKTDNTMIGLKFGEWTVIKEIKIPAQNARQYLCKCQCGEEKIAPGTVLRSGKSTKCRKCSFVKHNMSGTPTYKIWAGIISRCYNSKVKIYKYYGGRGITVCDSWKDFSNFYNDMGERPAGLQIDRIDNEKGYSKENCRWVTAKVNNPTNKKKEVLCQPK